jgi:tetratricopeptide (TPR) repeat protein
MNNRQTMRQCKFGLFLLLLVASVAVGQPKSPSGTEDAKTHFKEAEILYRLGDYEQALEKYKLAYKSSQASGLLYNMAQCQRNLGRYDEALRSYRLYLQDTPNSPYRANVEKMIAEMEERAAKQAEVVGIIPGPTVQALTPDSAPSATALTPTTNPSAPFAASSSPTPMKQPKQPSPPSLVPPALFVTAAAVMGGSFWLLRREALLNEDFVRDEKRQLLILGASADLSAIVGATWLVVNYKKRRASLTASEERSTPERF